MYLILSLCYILSSHPKYQLFDLFLFVTFEIQSNSLISIGMIFVLLKQSFTLINHKKYSVFMTKTIFKFICVHKIYVFELNVQSYVMQLCSKNIKAKMLFI